MKTQTLTNEISSYSISELHTMLYNAEMGINTEFSKKAIERELANRDNEEWENGRF